MMVHWRLAADGFLAEYQMTTLTVGAGEQYATLSAAVAASQNGDVIQVQAGTYTNDFSTITTSITIEGVGGMVNLVATEPPPNEKGILVIGTATSSPTVTLDNIEFSGAAISAADGGNAAGVRYQAGNLTINDCYFHNNQDGLLADADATGSISITNSEFADNGTTSGLTHNIYIGAVGTFSITGSYVTAANTGNEIQSRALVNNITNNRIVDGPTATASYSINLPNGGVDTVSGNTIEKGPNSQNETLISFGASGSVYAGSSLTVSNNTILNDDPDAGARAITNYSTIPVAFTGNSVYGLTAAQIATGPASVSGTTYLATEPAISTAPPYATLIPSVTNTLVISGGGIVVMATNLPGITRVELLKSTSLTLNSTPDLLVFGTAAEIGGSTISNFRAGDSVDLTNLATATAILTGISVGATSTVLTVTDGSDTAHVTLDGAFGAGSFQLRSDGSGGTDIGFQPTVGYAYTLPAEAVTLTLGSLANTVTTTAADLLHGDDIDGGPGGANTLALSGSGTFNLVTLGMLQDFSTITVRESLGTVLDLRAGLNTTVNVTGSAGITIVGTTNSDVINLGSGNDTVTLGVGETVNGGSGNDTFLVTAATSGATIHGGTGINTLVVSGGGTAVMGSKVTGISDVQLATKTAFTANGTANLHLTGSTGGGDTITLGAASQSVLSGGVNEHVMASAANAGARISGLGAGSELEITSGGAVTLNSATGGSAADPLIVKLDAATNLTLSPMQFIDAVGSSGNDTITAEAKYQTLTGGAGTDTLIGYAGGSDTFKDTAGGLNGDTIKNFLATDKIDITNLIAGTARLTAIASGTNTAVTVVSGASTTSFLMTGSFSKSGFAITTDGTGGMILTHG
jgi:hypothetical protein